MSRCNSHLLTLCCFLFQFIFAAIPAAEPLVNWPAIVGHATHFVDAKGSDSWPGTTDQPWATINHAADLAVAGDTIVVRGGRYNLNAQVRTHSSGRPDAWITYIGYPGDEVVLDAEKITLHAFVKGILNNGAFQIEGVSYVRVANFIVVNSHDAGITVRDSSDIEFDQ